MRIGAGNRITKPFRTPLGHHRGQNSEKETMDQSRLLGEAANQVLDLAEQMIGVGEKLNEAAGTRPRPPGWPVPRRS